MLIRELALQGKPTGEADILAVQTDVYAICAKLPMYMSPSWHSWVLETFKEWLARGQYSFECSEAEFSQKVEKVRQNPAKTASRAWDALWARRQQHPLLTFKSPCLKIGDGIVKQVLNNIDTQSTDARSLVLLARSLVLLAGIPGASAPVLVLEFVQQHYTKEQSDDLHREDSFKETWLTPAPENPYFKKSFSDHLQIVLDSHLFIHQTIPSIMGKPVQSYRKDEERLVFELDFTLDVISSLEPVSFQLDHATGCITSNEGRGVLHQLYGGGHVRQYFQQDGGIQSLADLAQSEGLGSEMRYDAAVGQWRIFNASLGIWGQVTDETARTKLSGSLKSLLKPIRDLADFMNYYDTSSSKFNWLLGGYVRGEAGDGSDSNGSGSDEKGDSDGSDSNGSVSDEKGDSDIEDSGDKKLKSLDRTRGKAKKTKGTKE